MTTTRAAAGNRRNAMLPRLLGLCAVAGLGWLLSACTFTDIFQPGGDSDSSGSSETSERPARAPGAIEGHRFNFSPPADFDPDEVEAAASATERLLSDLSERWADTDSVHFELDIDGTTYLDADGNIELDSARGDLKRPDQARARADVGVGFASFDVDLIVIGDDAYMTNFLNGDWERAPADFAFNPALIFDDERGIGGVVEEIDDPEVNEDADVDGRAAVEISGTVARSKVTDLVAGTLEGDEIHVTLWMDPDIDDLLRISLREPDEAVDDPTTWIITFTDHNAPVTIEAPDL